MEEGGKLEVAVEGEQTVPSFCFSFARPAVRLTKRGKKLEAHKLMDAVFDVSFDAKELRWRVTNAEHCERLDTEITHDALSGERFLQEKLRRANECFDANAFFYKKNILSVLREHMLSTVSDSSF